MLGSQGAYKEQGQAKRICLLLVAESSFPFMVASIAAGNVFPRSQMSSSFLILAYYNSMTSKWMFTAVKNGKHIPHGEPEPRCMEVQGLLAEVEDASFAELL